MQFFGVRHSGKELASTVESGSIRNQRVAFPVAGRMSHPTRLQRLRMRSVNVNDAYHAFTPALHDQHLGCERVLKSEHALLEFTRHRVRAAGNLSRHLKDSVDV